MLYFSRVEIESNLPFNLLPSPFTTAMMATTIHHGIVKAQKRHVPIWLTNR